MAKKLAHVPGKHWSEADKRRVIAVYKTLGNTAKTAVITGVPEDSIRYWQGSEWWQEALNALRAEDSSVLEESFTTIAKGAQVELQDRIKNGDHHIVKNKDGDVEIIRKPVPARDLNMISAIQVSKRKELMEKPSLELQTGTAERLLQLVEQFAKFASQKEIKKSVIDAEVIEDKVDAVQPQLQAEL